VHKNTKNNLIGSTASLVKPGPVRDAELKRKTKWSNKY